jgi:hypothetical protein
MDDIVVTTRLDALEDFREKQLLQNDKLTETLHRIEIALTRAVDKACPRPGLCMELETLWKAKWENDRDRFERVDAKLTANDEWHKEIELAMNKKLDAMKAAHEKTQTIVTRTTGGLAVLVVLMPWLVAAAKAYFAVHHMP